MASKSSPPARTIRRASGTPQPAASCTCLPDIPAPSIRLPSRPTANLSLRPAITKRRASGTPQPSASCIPLPGTALTSVQLCFRPTANKSSRPARTRLRAFGMPQPETSCTPSWDTRPQSGNIRLHARFGWQRGHRAGQDAAKPSGQANPNRAGIVILQTVNEELG